MEQGKPDFSKLSDSDKKKLNLPKEANSIWFLSGTIGSNAVDAMVKFKDKTVAAYTGTTGVDGRRRISLRDRVPVG